MNIHLTKFPKLPVIFSIYLKTDFFDFFEILKLSRTINLKNAFQFSVESACKICRYSILITRGVILKVAKNDKNTMCGGKGEPECLKVFKRNSHSSLHTPPTKQWNVEINARRSTFTYSSFHKSSSPGQSDKRTAMAISIAEFKSDRAHLRRN